MSDREPIHRRDVPREVADEVAFHMELRVRDLVARGTSPDEARRLAQAEFGDMRAVVSEMQRAGESRNRRVDRRQWYAELGQDFRFAFRLLWRRRAFAALATLTIALGIGAATAIYTVVDSVLLRPLPFADPGKLVAVWIANPSLAGDPAVGWLAEATPFGSDDYLALRRENTSFENLGFWVTTRAPVRPPSAPRAQNQSLLMASASLLPVLGERVALGRGFLPEENVLNGPRVALVSWEAWRSQMGGDPGILGRPLLINDTSFTIVGVLPEGLRVERGGEPPAFWVPAMQREYEQPDKHNRQYNVVGRLKTGVTREAAQVETARIIQSVSGDTTAHARVEDWLRDQTRRARGPLLLVFASAGLLLVIACVNVATIMLGEAARREREIAARVALGAGGGRIARQLLTESLAIALVGAVAGTGIAWGLTRLLVAGAPATIPGLDLATINPRVVLFAALCAGATGIIFGLVPAVVAARPDAASLLRSAGQSVRGRGRLQRILVAAETALSVVLLVGAALLGRSLQKVSDVHPGFESRGLVVVNLDPAQRFNNQDGVARREYFRRAVERLRAIPGVTDATAGSATPFTRNASSSPVWVTGRPRDEHAPRPFTTQHSVLPGYFGVMGVPLRSGRTLTGADIAGGELVAVINDATAHRDFPGESPLGKLVDYQGKARRIVGVVGDLRMSDLARDAGPEIFVPYDQEPWGGVSLLLRAEFTPALAAAVRSALVELDTDVDVANVTPMRILVERSYADARYRALLVAAFGLAATLLAAIGLYGVTGRAVGARTREVGVRVALGASRARVRALLMRETFTGVAVGVVAGVPVAYLLATRLTPFLFHVEAGDRLSFALVIVLVAAIAAVASYLPARAATRINPAVALGKD